MTIKKTKKNSPAAENSAAEGTGGATIADRFKLDLQDPSAGKPKVGTGDKVAFFAALIALGVAGFLAYTLWKHWEFLMPA